MKDPDISKEIDARNLNAKIENKFQLILILYRITVHEFSSSVCHNYN